MLLNRRTVLTTTTTELAVFTDEPDDLLSSIVVITVLIVEVFAILCCLSISLYIVVSAINYCLTVKKNRRRLKATEVFLKRSSIFSSRGRRLHKFRSLDWSTDSTSCASSEYRLNLRPVVVLPSSPPLQLPPPSPPPSQLQAQNMVAPMASHSADDHTGPYMPKLKCFSSSTTATASPNASTCSKPLEAKLVVPDEHCVA